MSSSPRVPDRPNHILFSQDFVAEVGWSSLASARQTLGIPVLPQNLNNHAGRFVIGHLLESGAWGDCWLTLIQLGPEVWRIQVLSDRPYLTDPYPARELFGRVIKTLSGSPTTDIVVPRPSSQLSAQSSAVPLPTSLPRAA